MENVGCEVKAGLCMVNGRRSFLAALLMVFFVVPGRFSAQGYSASQNSGRLPHPEAAQGSFNNGLAMTPPMGWSSWDNYRLVVNEGDIRKAADAMVATGLKDAGYEYVDIDSGWFFNKRDAEGDMVPDQQRFPSGMKALADYIHSKGLKAGIYTDVGEKGCGQGGSSPAYYDRDVKLFAEWGYDLVKVDSCGAPKRYRDHAIALREVQRSDAEGSAENGLQHLQSGGR